MRRPIRLAVVPIALALAASACGDGPSDPPGTGGSDGVNLRIETAYLVQSVQNREGTVSLVAGKDAYLRVFALADRANTATPAVRVRFYEAGAIRETFTIAADGPSVPTAVDQAGLASSWDVKIPGSLIRPGIQMLVDVDPTNSVAESNENDNSFPSDGSPRQLSVVSLAPFRIRFVPIVQAENGLTGQVSEANVGAYLAFSRKVHPVAGVDVEIRAPYSVRGLGFDPQGNTWQAAVSELDAVRVAEGSNRFYYGVVQTPYNGGGVVGIAAGIPARTALGWDRFPDASETLAHEVGHAWGRRHAPCGNVGGVDTQYPYTLGMIGVFGMDVETGELKQPSANTDIMGYCDANFWISDYTYSGILNYRRTNEPAASVAPRPALLVWGSIQDGRVVLEPAFQVTTRPELPDAPGPYTLEGLDAAGEVLFSTSFAGNGIADLEGDRRTFAFALPLAPEQMERLATLRVGGTAVHASARAVPGAVLERRASLSVAPRASVARLGTDRLAVRWDARAYPMVMVRDARTGDVLTLARGGAAELRAGAAEVELVLSDGVRSSTRRVAAGGL